MSVIVQFSIYPIGKGESLSEYVKGSMDIIDQSGLSYKMCPMGTAIEGQDWDEVMGVAKQCYDNMLEKCDRVAATILLDSRKGRENGLEGKIASVEEKLGRELKK